jgi:hypothetical protein
MRRTNKKKLRRMKMKGGGREETAIAITALFRKSSPQEANSS